MLARSSKLLVLLATVPAFAVACGGAPPPPPAAAVAKQPATAPTPPPDLTAVPAPKGLVALGRIKRVSDLLKTAGGWTGLPMPGADVVSELVSGESVGKVVDLDQPIDVALATDPSKRGMSVHWAVGAAVRSFDEAKSALSPRYKLIPGDNGALVIQGLGGPGDGDDDEGGRACELAPSAGAAATRLVCAGTDGGLRLLAPYLTRTTPRADVPSDVHIEVRFEPLGSYVAMMRGMLPSMLGGVLDVHRSSNPAGADAIDAVTGEVSDVLTDLDTLSLDAHLDDALAHFDAKANFKNAKSLVARLSTGHPDRVDLPPSSFWRLPVDADLGFFMRGFDTKDIEHPRDLVIAVLGHALEEEGLGEADRKPLLDALVHAVTTTAPIVFGRGADLAAIQKAAADVRSAKDDAAREGAARKAVEQVVGWWLVGLDESPARSQAAAKEIVSAWNRPGVAKWMKAEGGKGTTPPSLRLVPTPAALGLPKDTIHVELTIFPSAAPAPAAKGATKGAQAPAPKPEKPFKVHAFVVPDGGRVWIALGASDTLVAAKVRAALSGMPDSGTLTARTGLAPMKDARVSNGGFLTVRGVVTISPDLADDLKHRSGSRVLSAVASLPDQGATPIAFTTTASPGTPAAPAGSASGTLTVPRAVVEDLVKVALQGRI